MGWTSGDVPGLWPAARLSRCPVTQGNGPEIAAVHRNVPCDEPDR